MPSSLESFQWRRVGRAGPPHQGRGSALPPHTHGSHSGGMRGEEEGGIGEGEHIRTILAYDATVAATWAHSSRGDTPSLSGTTLAPRSSNSRTHFSCPCLAGRRRERNSTSTHAVTGMISLLPAGINCI